VAGFLLDHRSLHFSLPDERSRWGFRRQNNVFPEPALQQLRPGQTPVQHLEEFIVNACRTELALTLGKTAVNLNPPSQVVSPTRETAWPSEKNYCWRKDRCR